MCHTYKRFKTSIKSWIGNEKSVIKFNEKSWLKPYTDMKIEPRNNARNGFKKDFFKLINNAGFKKPLENVRKLRDIKLVTTEARRNYLLSKPSYHAKQNSENLLAMEIKKLQISMHKLVYLDHLYWN